MSEDHIGNLQKARAQLIERRRASVLELAGPYDRGKTEQAARGSWDTGHDRGH